MTKSNVVIAFFVAFFVMLTIMLNAPPSSKPLDVQAIKAQAKDVPYVMLAREPARWSGMTVVFEGKVVQTLDNALRVETEPVLARMLGSKIVWVDYKASEPRILEGDKIKFWGTFAGVGSYKAVLGQTIEIPRVKAFVVENGGRY